MKYTVARFINNGTLCIKTQKEYLIIKVERIIFCKADGSYSTIYLEDNSNIVVSKSLGVIEEKLKSIHFIRCHNSYLINIRKIERLNKKRKSLSVFGHIVPVSRRKYSKIIMILKSLNDQL